LSLVSDERDGGVGLIRAGAYGPNNKTDLHVFLALANGQAPSQKMIDLLGFSTALRAAVHGGPIHPRNDTVLTGHHVHARGVRDAYGNFTPNAEDPPERVLDTYSDIRNVAIDVYDNALAMSPSDFKSWARSFDFKVPRFTKLQIAEVLTAVDEALVHQGGLNREPVMPPDAKPEYVDLLMKPFIAEPLAGAKAMALDHGVG
jgi:hypothetical protein